jgi:ABC-type oligopeptide transport system substrate-binding subunit
MLAPLRESVVSKSDDWAKKPGTMVCSGPYKLSRISFSDNPKNKYTDPNFDEKKTVDGSTSFVEGVGSKEGNENLVNCFILERNAYYYRDSEKDQKLDVSVKPYRIVVDCGMPEEDIKEAFDKGVIQYMGDIPYSLRDDFAGYDVELKDSLSTATCYFNQNADINGTKLFSIPEVRQALSLAIDRKAIAKAVVYAEAATGLVPTGVFDTNSAKSLFRDNASGNFEFLATDTNKAATLLANANIDPEDYSFSLTVAAYDDVHVAIGEAIVASWSALGFDVELKKQGTVANNDYYKPVNDIPTDICDDIYAEDIRAGRYEVALIDLVAISADPFSVLAPFAKEFSGQSMDMSSTESYELTPHITGYDNPEYSAIIEAIYNNKTSANRSAKLHEAEAQLMKDMPVVPVIFNKTATLVGDGLKLNNKTLFWKKTSNYYGADTLKYVSVKDYDKYIAAGASFLEDKFEAYKELKTSYFSGEAFMLLSFEEFKEESSNFAFFFPKPVEDEKK